MRELAYAGLVAILFGLGSFYATDQFSGFNAANLVAGSVAIVTALALGARRLRIVGGPASRGVVLRGLLVILGSFLTAAAVERAAASSGIRFDWTFEQRFELSPATRKALAELPEPLTATLFYDAYDPRVRRTRLLLETLAEHGNLEVRERQVEQSPELEDQFGVGTSNTVVLQIGRRFETVERPTEGAIFEALYRLRSLEGGVVTLLRGEGQGDPEGGGDLGFSGLAAALDTEGYELQSIATAAMSEVPENTSVLLILAPRRHLRDEALDAIRRYLERGGRLVALLEPFVESGVETVLAEYGLKPTDAVIVDPASGAVESHAEGLCPVVYSYASHPVTQGLNRNRMTFFCGTRSFSLRKPRIDDRLESVALASPYSWLSDDPSLLERRSGTISPDGAEQTYHPIAVVGRYERDGGQTRIVAIGDSDFATNRYLRALYNLDLVMNAIHWSAAREPEITLRPKIRTTVQFPLPLQNTLTTLYGVGLLVPELLLIGGGLIWLRRRNS
jgi:hypothetical protein